MEMQASLTVIIIPEIIHNTNEQMVPHEKTNQ